MKVARTVWSGGKTREGSTYHYTQLALKLIGDCILNFIYNVTNLKDSELIIDKFRAYELVGKKVKYAILNYKDQYADGNMHTNTIEEPWGLLKRAWYGQHHLLPLDTYHSIWQRHATNTIAAILTSFESLKKNVFRRCL